MNSTQPSDKRLTWSEVPIHFDVRDHPVNLYDGPLLPLIIKPYIGNYKVGQTLVDSGSSLNLLFTNTYDSLGLPRKHLLPVKEPFYGIMPGMSAYPLRRINLQVTHQEGENTRSEFLTLKVADFDLAYNCILGQPYFLKKFMAVAHFAYLVLKVPGPRGPMTIHGDHKGAVACDMKTLNMIRQYKQVPGSSSAGCQIAEDYCFDNQNSDNPKG